jgi:hypothetical protein
MLNSPLKRLGARRSGTGSVLALAFWLCLASGAAWSQSPDPISFQNEIYPILEQRCHVCHGELQRQSELDLRTRAAMLKGGANGPALVPGDARESRLYRRIAGIEAPVMPMGMEMPQEEILKLRDWINQGAPAEGASQQAAAAHGAEAAAEDWWAFHKPLRPAVPEIADARWSKNPIDAFTYRKLQEKGLKPAPRADKTTLVRRAYLDLLGTLPTPAEVDAFVNDDAPDAFARLVDRLLESPRYGERWGRHWLDVARYADSGGYEHDFDYPAAWRYRDYVIGAFNQDKPYDQFVREQLAGDELDKVTFDSLTATGFNRVGPTVGYREKDNPQYRYSYLDDMIGTTSRAFMGLTVNCARCHDHKFDPITQVEYYRMMAVFFPYVNYDWPLAPPEDVAAYEAKKAAVEGRIQPLKDRIAEIQAPYRELAFQEKLQEFPEEIQVAVRTPEPERSEGQKLLAAQVESIRGNADKFMTEEHSAEVKKLRAEIDEIEKELPAELPFAMGIRDGDYRFTPDGRGDEPLPGKGDRITYDFEGTYLPVAGKPYEPPRARILPTADYNDLGDPVDPGFLKVVSKGHPATELPPSRDYISTGRRRALAEWLVSDDHPLTSRVMVNRIWQNHFGRGIVATPSNFGKLGQLPTHPELLDWLATEFVGQGWSIKAMHRLMMNSESYQMTAAFFDEGNAKKDPRNDFLWRYRQRRLEAEIIRDTILAAAGNLNLEMGGAPFFPPIPKEVQESYPNGKWKANEEGPAVWRRSVYSYFKRGLRYPMFDVFDLPNLNVTCESRVTTTVPTQALTLLNNTFVLDQARYFAERIAAQAGSEQDARVRAAYRIALGREPLPKEIQENVGFLNRQHDYHESRSSEDASLLALLDLCHVILNLNEFIYIR